MTSRTLLVALALAAGVAGYALLRDDAPARDVPAAPTRPAARAPAPARPARPYDADAEARDVMASILRIRLERALESPEEIPLPASVQSRLEAEAAFEVAMEKLEELADKGDPVSRRRRARLYRHTNDAFAALSDYLDPTSAHDRAALEDSYVRMKAMLSEVGAEPNLD